MAIFSKKPKTDEKVAKDETKASQVKDTKKTEPSMKELYKDTESKKADAKGASKTLKSATAYRILAKPLVTEKAADLSAHNQYVFVVQKSANKIEVAKAIETVYGIKPLSVNMINNRGKQVRRGRETGKRKDWKKAIVTLPAGKTINIYEGV